MPKLKRRSMLQRVRYKRIYNRLRRPSDALTQDQKNRGKEFIVKQHRDETYRRAEAAENRKRIRKLKHAKEHDDSPLSAEEPSLFHDVKEVPNNSTFVLHGEKIELKLDIKVEETILQEQKYRNEDPVRSNASALQAPGGKSKDVELENAEDQTREIKEEILDDGEEIMTEHQSTTESSECHGILNNRNDSFVSQETGDQFYPCSICGLTYASKPKMRHHKIMCHQSPKYKCSFCHFGFHFEKSLRRHEKGCSELRCGKCGSKYATRQLLNIHNILKHPLDGKSKNDEAEDAEDLENGIKVEEEYPEGEEEIITVKTRNGSLVRYKVVDVQRNSKEEILFTIIGLN